MSEKIELKPCPNKECGGSANFFPAIIEKGNKRGASVKCSKCGHSTGRYIRWCYKDKIKREIDTAETKKASNLIAQEAWNFLPDPRREVWNSILIGDLQNLIEEFSHTPNSGPVEILNRAISTIKDQQDEIECLEGELEL